MNFANIEIKKEIAKAGLTQKMVAERMGITPEYLSRNLRYEPLRKGIEERIYYAISGDVKNARKYKKRYAAWVKGICDSCGFATAYCEDFKFCPNCGAKMMMSAEEDDGK